MQAGQEIKSGSCASSEQSSRATPDAFKHREWLVSYLRVDALDLTSEAQEPIEEDDRYVRLTEPALNATSYAEYEATMEREHQREYEQNARACILAGNNNALCLLNPDPNLDWEHPFS